MYNMVYIKSKESVKCMIYFPAANAKAPGQIFDLTEATAVSGCINDDCLTVHGNTESIIASSDRGVNKYGPISFLIVSVSSSSSCSSPSSNSS